jgi:hypothetical protein
MLPSTSSIIVVDASSGDFSCFPTPPGSPRPSPREHDTEDNVQAQESSSDAQSALPVAVLCEEEGADATLVSIGDETVHAAGTSSTAGDATNAADASSAPASRITQPLKKRPVGPMLEQQRAAPFKSLADALGSLGLQKVHTETGGINCCQIYSFLISSGKMHPKQQTIGYASTNLVSACNVCLVCSLDAVRAWQGCFLQGECAPT